MASCMESMFDAGLREATGDFAVARHDGVGAKVHVVATLQELEGGFDGVYAEFFSAGYVLAP